MRAGRVVVGGECAVAVVAKRRMSRRARFKERARVKLQWVVKVFVKRLPMFVHAGGRHGSA